MSELELGYDLDKLYRYGIRLPITIELGRKYAHLLIVGKSGSGKSTAVLLYLFEMLSSKSNRVYIADYKGGDEYYDYFDGSGSYFSGENAIRLIEDFYELFSLVRSRHIKLDKHYSLVVEEYRGLLAYLDTKDKKLKKEIIGKIGEILAVGRGLNIGIILVVQRADASLFSEGAREQFQCLLSFGRTSKEQFQMLGFSGEMEENPSTSYDAGKGLLLIDGKKPLDIIVPWITNFEEMTAAIRRFLDCQPSLQALVRAIAEGKGEGL